LSVALDGETIMIGARLNDERIVSGGAVYVFENNGDDWLQTDKLVGIRDSVIQSHKFGESISIKDGFAIIGEHGLNDAGIRTGSAHIFEKIDNTWVHVTKLLANDGNKIDRFGHSSVSIDGNVAVVGAYKDSDIGKGYGSVYVFENNGIEWVETKLVTENGIHFGTTVLIDDDTIIVGARGENVFGDNSGAVYVFEKTSDSIVQTHKITPHDGERFALFGTSISLNGDILVIGSPGNENRGIPSSAYVFEKTDNTWVQIKKLTVDDGILGDQFGLSVSITDSNIVIGARDSQSAYFFTIN